MFAADTFNECSYVISPCATVVLSQLFNSSVITGYVWRANKSNSKFFNCVSANLNGVIIDEEAGRRCSYRISCVGAKI